METRTRVKISADDREVKKLGQTISSALSPKHAKELKSATRDLERQFGAAAKAQAGLIKQLAQVDKGTKAYKALKKELKGVQDQADLASKALSSIERAQSRMSRVSREGGARNFGLGAAQGLGVAQYLPSGPGAGYRVAGALAGGAIRRGAGAMAAPFTTPGIGGVAQGLAGIPVVGGFAAGSLQAAAGAYQSAVGFDRARQQNLYFANDAIGQRYKAGVNPAYQKQQADRADARQQYDKAIARSSDLQLQQDVLKTFSAGPAGRAKVIEQARRGYPAAQSILGRSRAASVERMMGAQGVPGGFASAAGMGKGDLAGVSGRIQGALTGDQASAKEEARSALDRIEAQKLELKASKMRGGGVASGLGSNRTAVNLGFGPMQAEAMKGQFYQAAGGMFGQSEFNEGLVAQASYGVGMSQSGQFARGGRAGGGGTGDNLTKILQGAFIQGLRGSQIPEYLDTLVGLQQQAEKQGIKISAEGFQQLTFGLEKSGIQGVQKARVAGSLVGGLGDLASRGVQSPVDMLRLRAAGYKPGSGPEGYAQAMADLEDPTKQQGIVQNYLKMAAQGTGGGGKQGALLFKRLMNAGGTAVSMAQASQLIEAYKDGRPPDVNDLIAGRERMGGAQGELGRAEGRVSAGAAFARKGAQIEQLRIGVGKQAGWVAGFEANALKAAGVMNNFGTSLQDLTKVVGKAMMALNVLTTGGLGGMGDKIRNELGEWATKPKLPKGK